MSTQRDIYAILESLLAELPPEVAAQSSAAAEAQVWLKQHSSRAADVRTTALIARDAVDALLRALEGGKGLDVLRDARAAMSRYVTPVPSAESDDDTLTVQVVPSGGVTLSRRGKHLTINDAELEAVREAINERKREVRKLQRRGLL